jgi:hypothetical protein
LPTPRAATVPVTTTVYESSVPVRDEVLPASDLPRVRHMDMDTASPLPDEYR